MKFFKQTQKILINSNYTLDLSSYITESNIKTSNSRKRILLTSSGLENEVVRRVFLDNIGKDTRMCKVLFVTCAARDKESKDMIPECYRDLLNVNIAPNNIIEYNFDNMIDMSDYNIIYFCGGDENYLIKKINKSGMREILINVVNDGLFYIGVSAGACIASPYVKNGLDFCPNKVDVHYDEKDSTDNGKLPTVEKQINLSNQQAVWINGKNMSIIGKKIIDNLVYTKLSII